MYDPIDETFLEFAQTIKYLLRRGWTFDEIDYGERRLDIGSRITFRLGDREETCYNGGVKPQPEGAACRYSDRQGLPCGCKPPK